MPKCTRYLSTKGFATYLVINFMDFDKEIFDKVSDSHIIYFFFVRSKRKSKISFDLKPAVSFGGSTIDFVAKKERKRKRNGIKIQIQG